VPRDAAPLAALSEISQHVALRMYGSVQASQPQAITLRGRGETKGASGSMKSPSTSLMATDDNHLSTRCFSASSCSISLTEPDARSRQGVYTDHGLTFL
jgi:hypothetical protein